MKNVFLSYTEADKQKVNFIKMKLKRNGGFNPIVIADDRKSLATLTEKVKNGIDNAEIFIPILTKSSIHTQWINQEIGYASAFPEKLILPIVESAIVDDLKGFIHNQVDLPYSFFSSPTPKIEYDNFKKCFNTLFSDLLLPDVTVNTIDNDDLNKRFNNFKIVSPKKSEIYKEWVEIDGVGAPPKWSILLFTWVKNTYLNLQDDIATSDSNGNWYNQKCKLQTIGAYREIYVIAVEPKSIPKVKELFKEYGKKIDPISFQDSLLKNGIRCIVSPGKKLIRPNLNEMRQFKSDNNIRQILMRLSNKEIIKIKEIIKEDKITSINNGIYSDSSVPFFISNKLVNNLDFDLKGKSRKVRLSINPIVLKIINQDDELRTRFSID